VGIVIDIGLIEKAPKTSHDAAKFADEFAILYRPLKGNSNVAINLTQNAENLNQGNKKRA